MEIARIYDWFNTVYKKVSAARHQRKSMFEDEKVQSIHSVRSKEQVRESLLDSERRLYDHQNQFLRAFPETNANYTKEEQEENKRIMDYCNLVDKGV